MGFGADLLKNMVTRVWKLPKSESLKSANYFRFVSQTIGVEATTFLSRILILYFKNLRNKRA